MKVYHGTTAKAAESIKLQGLKPNTKASFKLVRDEMFNQPIETYRLAYVTPDKAMAENFARFRAEYERAKRGSRINWGKYNPEIIAAGYTPVSMIKLTTEQQPNAVPAVVELDLPDYWAGRFAPDPAGDVSHGLVYAGTIPAEYVAKVEVLQ